MMVKVVEQMKEKFAGKLFGAFFFRIYPTIFFFSKWCNL